jgi:hypothetical protein
MKRILLIVSMFIFSSAEFYSQNGSIYLSPGIGISWDLNGNFVFSPKFSVGYLENSKFYNITIGRTSSSNNEVYPYYYVETQFGVLSKPMEFRKLQLFTGGGIGVNLHLNEVNNSISFRASAFTGYGAFIKATIITKEKVNADFGLEAVMPIPLNFKFGNPGG